MKSTTIHWKQFRAGLRDIFAIFLAELSHIFKDTGVLVIFFAAGLLYPVLYGFTYKNEVLRDIPAVVADLSNTATSRNFIRHLDATPEVEVCYKRATMEEAEALYVSGKAMAIIGIPASFSEDLSRTRQTRITVCCNMASMMYYKGVYAAVSYVSLDMGRTIQIQSLTRSGLSRQQAVLRAEPIRYEPVSLFNPKGGFASFLMPAVLILIIQQTLVLGIGMLAGTAREENTFHNLIPYQRKYHGTMRIISGKALAYFLIYALIASYNLIAIPHLFNLPHLASLPTIFFFMIPLLLACIFLSMTLSVFFWNRENSLLLYLFTSLPLLFISGFSWPATHIHGFWKSLGVFFPSTLGIQGFLKLNTMGASLSLVRYEYLGLWVQTGLYFLLAFFVYRWQILQSEARKTRQQ